MERIEIFGRHAISATAVIVRGGADHAHWEVDVAAVALGHETDAPLVRFAAPERLAEDPGTALEAAVRMARRALTGQEKG